MLCHTALLPITWQTSIRCTRFLPHLSFTLFYCLGRAVRPPDAAVPLSFFQLLIVEACDLFDRICAANCPCWFASLKIIIVLTLFAIFFAFAYVFSAFVTSSYMIVISIVFAVVISIVFAVGYSVAYLFHMASCSLSFRFVEFTGLSCCVGRCGWTVDEGGPEGTGLPRRAKICRCKKWLRSI